jgi:acetyltransferase-like isoleucine patch superfamily enzyme
LLGDSSRKNWEIGKQMVGNALSFASSTVVNGTTFTDYRLVLLDTGYVGVGQAAPTSLLHVTGTDPATSYNGVLRLDGTARCTLAMNSGAGGFGQVMLFPNGTQDFYFTNNDGPVILRASSAEGMRVAVGGNVGIGTGATVSAKLHVIATSEQLRIGYDAANYGQCVVTSTGNLTIGTISGSAAGTMYLAPANGLTYLAGAGNNTLYTINYNRTNAWTRLTGSELQFIDNSQLVHQLSAVGETVFNQQGADLDFRIEGDTNTNLFFVDASADCIGINVAPSGTYKLQIDGKIYATEYIQSVQAMVAGTGQFNIIYPANDLDLTIQTRNTTTREIIFKSVGTTPTETARMTTGGNVGIGTGATVSAKLHVIAATEQLRIGTDGTFYTSFTSSATGDLTIAPNGEDLAINARLALTSTTDARITFYRNLVDTVSIQVDAVRSYWYNNTTAKTLFSISHTGNVGITTNTPDSLGNMTIAGAAAASAGLAFYANTGATNADKWLFYATTGGKFTFTTKASGAYADVLVLDSATSYVGIGTNAPASKLHVIATTEQLRLGNDATYYTSFTVDNAGDLTIAPSGANLAVTADVDVPSNKSFYLGAPATDGTWRITRSGNNLLMERRESGAYVTKQTIAA